MNVFQKSIVIGALALSATTAIAAPSYTQVYLFCDDGEVMAEQIAAKWGERPLLTGEVGFITSPDGTKTTNGGLILAVADGGAFTVVFVPGDGRACIAAAGSNLAVEKP